MDLEDIILNKISQRQIPYDIVYMWNLKPNKIKTIKQTKTKFMGTENILVVARGRVG